MDRLERIAIINRVLRSRIFWLRRYRSWIAGGCSDVAFRRRTLRFIADEKAGIALERARLRHYA